MNKRPSDKPSLDQNEKSSDKESEVISITSFNAFFTFNPDIACAWSYVSYNLLRNT